MKTPRQKLDKEGVMDAPILDSGGRKYPLNEVTKTIVINGVEYPLHDDVWKLMLRLSWERDYYKEETEK